MYIDSLKMVKNGNNVILNTIILYIYAKWQGSAAATKSQNQNSFWKEGLPYLGKVYTFLNCKRLISTGVTGDGCAAAEPCKIVLNKD